MQIPGPAAAQEDCITAVSSRGPPQLLQPAEHQLRHSYVFSWLENQAPFLAHSCEHTGTGALSPCVTHAAVPHWSHSVKAHSRSSLQLTPVVECDNSTAAVAAGCLSRLAFVLVQVAPGGVRLTSCVTPARKITPATAKGRQRGNL